MAQAKLTQDDIGSTFYTRDGAQVELVALTTTGEAVVVETLEFETWDGDIQHEQGRQLFADFLYRKRPTKAKDEEIEALDAKIASRRAELERITGETLRAAAEHADLMKRLQGTPALQYIDRFLTEPPTWAVIRADSGGIQCLPAADALTPEKFDGDSWNRDRGWKLLTLFGKTNGDLAWFINQYRDGSGHNHEAHLFYSEEEARAFVAARITENIAAQLLEADEHPWRPVDWIKGGEKNGVELSPEAAAFIAKYRRDEALRFVNTRRDELAKAQATLDALGPSKKSESTDRMNHNG